MEKSHNILPRGGNQKERIREVGPILVIAGAPFSSYSPIPFLLNQLFADVEQG